MTYILITLAVIAWINIGYLAYNSTLDIGGSPLETMVLPLRLVVIILSPIGLLIFERHALFYPKSEDETVRMNSDNDS